MPESSGTCAWITSSTCETLFVREKPANFFASSGSSAGSTAFPSADSTTS